MKPALAKLKDELAHSSFVAREAEADRIFERARLRDAMLTAARRGLGFVQITSDFQCDLRQTSAARTSCAWLLQQGLAYQWDTAQGSASPTGESQFCLTIRWDDCLKEKIELARIAFQQ